MADPDSTASEYRPEQDPANRVLPPDARRSKNFFRSDRILRAEIGRRCSASGLGYMASRLDKLGSALAATVDELSLTADREAPRLESRNLYGERVDQLAFHPAYEALTAIAVDSGMFQVKWAPEARAQYAGEAHRLGFAAGQLFAMGEAGLYCPLCMTDGVARILDRHAAPADRGRLLPGIATANPAELLTGAMFLTEKAGGSDVGANRCIAVAGGADSPGEGPWYRLYGEKWFCSNAGAPIALVLARSESGLPGTRGLGLYLLEKTLPNGQDNPRRYIRLKEKLGVRSMASAEIDLDGAWAKRLGEPEQGFAIMAEMINLSRLYNAVTAVAIARRAIVEAWMHLRERVAFGRKAVEHALVRERLQALGSRWLGEFLVLWEAITALDEADAGDREAQALVRLLTPMVKRSSAEFAVYATRECMELMGGIGYIEQGVMPKLHRDALVLPIWEGAGNIMLLDMLRALDKDPEQASFLRRMHGQSGPLAMAQKTMAALAEDRKSATDSAGREQREWRSRGHLENLTLALQAALVGAACDGPHAAWAEQAQAFYTQQVVGRTPDDPIPLSALETLLGWNLEPS